MRDGECGDTPKQPGSAVSTLLMMGEPLGWTPGDHDKETRVRYPRGIGATFALSAVVRVLGGAAGAARNPSSTDKLTLLWA